MTNLHNYSNELKSLIYGAILFLQIEIDVALILISLMCLDTLFGMIKATLIETLVFSWKALFKGLCVKLIILLIPMTVALVAKGLGMSDFKILVAIVMKALVISEGSSIWNSFLSIKKGEEIKQTDMVAVLIERISNYFKSIFDKLTKI
jgi:phage-related holin